MAIKPVTLWSWLIKSETREEFRCPPDVEVTNEMFAAELVNHVRANRLPASVELCEVKWDDTDIRQERVAVRYTGKNSNTDVIRFLFGIEQMGSFAYLERKTYLKHPDLPKNPRAKQNIHDPPEDIGSPPLRIFVVWWIFVGIGGALTLLLGLTDAIQEFIVLGLVIAVIAVLLALVQSQNIARYEERLKEYTKAYSSRQEIILSNYKADEEQSAQEQAWSSWIHQVLQSAYLQKIDDESGRFSSAISTTVDDVVKVLFIDRNAELRNRTQHAQTQEEIEKELERRRSEAFK